MPASVTGMSTIEASGCVSWRSTHARWPSSTVMPRPPSPSDSRIAGWWGSRREEPRTAGRVPSHREDPRIVGVEDVPTLRPRDARDDALHLGELVDGVDAVQAQMVLGHVRHDGDVVVPDADASQQHASPRRLEHRHVGLLGERARGSAEARSSRRTRPAMPSSRNTPSVDEYATVLPALRTRCASSRTVVVFPFVPVTCTTGIGRIGDGRHVAGLDGDQATPRLGDQPIGRAAEQRRHARGDLVPERLGGGAPAPRERHDDLVPLVPRTCAHREPSGSAGHRDPARQERRHPRDHAASLFALGRPGPGAAGDAEPFGDREDPLVARGQPAGHGEGELDRRSREVEVGALQHPELDQPDGVGHVRPPAVRRWTRSLARAR